MKYIFTGAARYLQERGYIFVRTVPGEEFVSEESREACFYKTSGAVLNIVILINGFVEGEPIARAEELSRRLLDSFTGKMKTVCLGILIGGDKTEEFISGNDFDPMAEVIKIHWAVDTDRGELLCRKNAPNRLDGIEEYFRSVLKGESGGLTYSKNPRSFLRQKKALLTYCIMAVCLCVFAAMTIDGGSTSTDTLLRYGALYAPFIKQGELFRLFAYMFLHIGMAHLLSNMFSLYIFGVRCERYYGYIRFLIVYVLSGLGCALMSMTFSGDTVSAGASGAIMGLMGSALAYTAINKIKMDGLDVYVYIVFAIINLGFGFVYADVDNFGHIGGFITGLIIGMVFGYMDKRKAEKNEQSL